MGSQGVRRGAGEPDLPAALGSLEVPLTLLCRPPGRGRASTGARRAICKAMREANEGGLTHAKHLEPLREYATIQEVLAVRRELSESPA